MCCSKRCGAETEAERRKAKKQHVVSQLYQKRSQMNAGRVSLSIASSRGGADDARGNDASFYVTYFRYIVCSFPFVCCTCLMDKV